jgi:hypothetical protein
LKDSPKPKQPESELTPIVSDSSSPGPIDTESPAKELDSPSKNLHGIVLGDNYNRSFSRSGRSAAMFFKQSKRRFSKAVKYHDELSPRSPGKGSRAGFVLSPVKGFRRGVVFDEDVEIKKIDDGLLRMITGAYKSPSHSRSPTASPRSPLRRTETGAETDFGYSSDEDEKPRKFKLDLKKLDYPSSRGKVCKVLGKRFDDPLTEGKVCTVLGKSDRHAVSPGYLDTALSPRSFLKAMTPGSFLKVPSPISSPGYGTDDLISTPRTKGYSGTLFGDPILEKVGEEEEDLIGPAKKLSEKIIKWKTHKFKKRILNSDSMMAANSEFFVAPGICGGTPVNRTLVKVHDTLDTEKLTDANTGSDLKVKIQKEILLDPRKKILLSPMKKIFSEQWLLPNNSYKSQLQKSGESSIQQRLTS